ncbi:hypothetical protein TVAG_026100 [Trichomonas vaginalis G3]|uniref:Uncharacterized protein n=1 Tax=Trichomonas vaginalis (strain ATCC PRA-98 / G3) TaxID=412133 RepID=A2DZ13_TRIV3|nr:hypothetical protein TVAGG3_0504360 [Trichomonas vaginalis G3]EAY14289.1 hypothetical protein TVAG_026100 [Trichomonas vaginalis G3]KAI5517308.1 hypothetical protein TVAGG3_0504360 [Trichomonas vaginalis G3]|eukprot:XP_001326512.1 hypothetical protein [Trichomonas vaginalis G3]
MSLFDENVLIRDCGKNLTKGMNVCQLRVGGQKYSFQIAVNGFNQAIDFPLLQASYFNNMFGFKAQVEKESQFIEIIPKLPTNYFSVSFFLLGDSNVMVNTRTPIIKMKNQPVFVQLKTSFDNKTKIIKPKLYFTFNRTVQFDSMLDLDYSLLSSHLNNLGAHFSVRVPKFTFAAHFNPLDKNTLLSSTYYAAFRLPYADLELQYENKDKKFSIILKSKTYKGFKGHIGAEYANHVYLVGDLKYKRNSTTYEVAADTAKLLKVSVSKQINDEFNLTLTASRDFNYAFPIKFGLYMTFNQ